MAAKVYRGSVRPHWIDEDHFWYRNDLAGGKREFLLVDAAAPSRKPAFDAVRLAASLTKLQGAKVDPDKLPIDNISIEAKTRSLVVLVGVKAYAVDAAYNLTEVKSDLGRSRAYRPGDGPRVSRSSTVETTLTFVNNSGSDARLFWIDTEGERHDYGTVAKDERREMHTYATHVWLVTGVGSGPIAVFQAGEAPELAVIGPVGPANGSPGRPRFRRSEESSPDGKWRVMVKDYNLYLTQQAGGGDRPLTQDGSATDRYEGPFVWSPDSTHLLAFKTIPEEEHNIYEVESSPKDQVQPKLHTIHYLKPGDQIAHTRPHMFDITASKEISVKDDLMPNPWSLNQTEWDPDSKRVTMLYNQRGHQVMRMISIDAATGAVTAPITEEAKTFIDYTNKVYLNRLPATHEAIWMSERDGWNHLYLYDTAAGKVENQITRGNWVVHAVDKVDAASRRIWFQAGGIVPGEDPYYIHHARINFDSTGLTLLTVGDGTHSFEYSPNGKFLVDTYSRVDMAPISVLRNAADGTKRLDLETGDISAVAAAGYQLPERFVAKGRDGITDIYGVICRPSTFDSSRKYPVVESIYAGPQGAFVPKAFGRTGGLQAMAELGFIVVQIDGMGTNFRSKAFHDACWKNLADAGFPDRILWIKAAAAKYPYMDLTRVGIYGTSAGGQNALGGLLLHGDFYKVGVSDSGCDDNRMDKIWWNEQWMGWPVGPEYAASSNVTYADRLSGKLLLMEGEMDTNVDPASTMQVVNALIKANKDFDLLVVPGAGHGVAGTPYGRRKLQDFLVRNLLGVEPRRQ